MFIFCRKEESEEEGEVNENDVHPLVSVSNINPEDIPDIPVNKFLMRSGGTKDKNDYKPRGSITKNAFI